MNISRTDLSREILLDLASSAKLSSLPTKLPLLAKFSTFVLADIPLGRQCGHCPPWIGFPYALGICWFLLPIRCNREIFRQKNLLTGRDFFTESSLIQNR